MTSAVAAAVPPALRAKGGAALVVGDAATAAVTGTPTLTLTPTPGGRRPEVPDPARASVLPDGVPTDAAAAAAG